MLVNSEKVWPSESKGVDKPVFQEMIDRCFRRARGGSAGCFFGLDGARRRSRTAGTRGSISVLIGILGIAAGLSVSGPVRAQDPGIEFTSVPPLGSNANLTGTTANVDPATHRVVVYIFVQGWWIKPTNAAPLTVIQPNGAWTTDITTGGADAVATKIAAFLLPQGYAPPILNGAATLPAELGSNALAAVSTERQSPNAFHFSGYDWDVKTSGGFLFGPGPNIFSDSTDNVWVDGSGKLHLRVTFSGGQWRCAEVVLSKSLGFGTYRFYIDSPVDPLDPNVVLGLFTWSDDPAFTHREIDIEMSRWGNAADPANAQYVIQPFGTPGNLTRWTIPAAASPTTHSFQWTDGHVDFVSHNGAYAPPPASVPEITQWTRQGAAVPPPGDERVRLNLWLFNGAAPSDGQEVEVVISRFVFVPSPVPLPVIDSISRDAGGAVTVAASGVPQLLYRLECSGDLVTWSLVESLIADETDFEFSDANAADPPWKFYRIAVPEQ